MVIFCLEQILNREESQFRRIIGWPTGAIRISPAGEDDSLGPRDTGVWATIDDEVDHLRESVQRCGTINEESPGTATQAAETAAPASDAPGTYAAANSMPPEPPMPRVPTVLPQPALQHPS